MTQRTCKITGLKFYECAHCLPKKRGSNPQRISSTALEDVDRLWEIDTGADHEDEEKDRVRKEDEEFPDPAEVGLDPRPQSRKEPKEEWNAPPTLATAPKTVKQVPLLPAPSTPINSVLEIPVVRRPGYYTALEVAEASESLIKEGWSVPQIAVELGRTDTRIYQCLPLLKLCPEVRSLMARQIPRGRRLEIVAAIALIPLEPTLQIQIAREILHSGLSGKEAVAFIRRRAQEKGFVEEIKPRG